MIFVNDYISAFLALIYGGLDNDPSIMHVSLSFITFIVKKINKTVTYVVLFTDCFDDIVVQSIFIWHYCLFRIHTVIIILISLLYAL